MTLREDPQEADTVSQKLLLRGGFVRRVSAGVYTFLPMGLRVLRKVERIVREEMTAAGAEELLMPHLLPKELWEETGRWHLYGKELMRLQDRNAREYCLGPTHEELITDLARKQIRSYRQLPRNLYQIQTKFRDEIRPRFGLLRAREFLMKDAYSFHRDEASLSETYEVMVAAYNRIFARCGLDFRKVEAFSGAIGGEVSHEFIALSSTGEADILACDCGYAANGERAEGQPAPAPEGDEAELREVATPGKSSAAEVAALLGVEPRQLIKTMLVRTEKGCLAALVRGDRDLNLEKLRKAAGVTTAQLADAEEIEQATGGPAGFSGPVGLRGMSIYADEEVMGLPAAVTGANKPDAHLVGVKPGRDFTADLVADLRLAREGDRCTRCSEGVLKRFRGIEVGHVFKLGKKYSAAMGATFLDEEGVSRPLVMGCYGIGVSRILTAIVEQNHDAHGMIWPPAVAPLHALVLSLDGGDAALQAAAEDLYRRLQGRLEVGYDDREERAGVKFKDADLVGIPLQIIVGRKLKEEGKVEVKVRATGERRLLDAAAAADFSCDFVRAHA